MQTLEQRLQQVSWATLQHAYGSAQDTPQNLLELLADDEGTREHALGELWASICHQGSVYEASCAAVPFLIEILPQAPVAARGEILNLLSGLAHAQWYAKRFQASLTINHGINVDSRHQWWSLESFLQEGGNIYHEPEWLLKGHELVGEGMPVYLKLLHEQDWHTVTAVLDLLAGYREFESEIVPELLALHKLTQEHPLQSLILESLAALLPADAPEWSLYRQYVVDQDAPALLRFTAAEALAWYQPELIPTEAVALLTDTMLSCDLQAQDFAGTYWSELSVGAFTHALLALCRLERSLATQALSRVLSHAASGWSILDTIRVAEALLDVAFFGGWVDDRYWTYETNISVSVEEAGLSSAEVIQQQFERIRQVRDATEVGKALFGWKYSTSFGSYSKDQRQIYVFGYDRQEEDRLRQLYAEQHDQALTASQRLALETVVHCDALWQKSHDLLVIYGLPVEREQLRQFLTGEAF